MSDDPLPCDEPPPAIQLAEQFIEQLKEARDLITQANPSYHPKIVLVTVVDHIEPEAPIHHESPAKKPWYKWRSKPPRVTMTHRAPSIGPRLCWEVAMVSVVRPGRAKTPLLVYIDADADELQAYYRLLENDTRSLGKLVRPEKLAELTQSELKTLQMSLHNHLISVRYSVALRLQQEVE